KLREKVKSQLTPASIKILDEWEAIKEKYASDQFTTIIRNREITTELKVRTLSGLSIPKVALPKYKDYGEILNWVYKENVPGAFPYTAGVFPFKRQGEDPKRQF